MSVHVYLEDSTTLDHSENPFLTAFDPDPRIYLFGPKNDIDRWLEQHSKLEIHTSCQSGPPLSRFITVRVAKMGDGAREIYLSQVARAFDLLGQVAKIIEKVRRAVWCVTLDGSGNLHPNPFAWETRVRAGTTLGELRDEISSLATSY